MIEECYFRLSILSKTSLRWDTNDEEAAMWRDSWRAFLAKGYEVEIVLDLPNDGKGSECLKHGKQEKERHRDIKEIDRGQVIESLVVQY